MSDRKLTDDQVLALRRGYRNREFTMKEKAAELGLNINTFNRMMHGLTYKHVPEAHLPGSNGSKGAHSWARKRGQT